MSKIEDSRTVFIFHVPILAYTGTFLNGSTGLQPPRRVRLCSMSKGVLFSSCPASMETSSTLLVSLILETSTDIYSARVSLVIVDIALYIIVNTLVPSPRQGGDTSGKQRSDKKTNKITTLKETRQHRRTMESFYQELYSSPKQKSSLSSERFKLVIMMIDKKPRPWENSWKSSKNGQ